MKYSDLISGFIKNWEFTRAETIEILNSLDDQKLQYKPEGEKWQPLYYQFGCMGRTQMVYTKAIETSLMDFSYFHSDDLPTKSQNQTKEDVKKFLEGTDQRWRESIEEKLNNEDFLVKWPGYSQNLFQQMTALISHERLHHGQIIAYFTLAGFNLPKGFKSNWAL